MKRASLLTLTAAVILIAVCIFCACNGGDIPSGVPVGWQTYLDEVASAVSDDIEAHEDKLNVYLNGSIGINGNYYALTVKVNYDVENPDRNKFAIVLKDKTDAVAVSVLSDKNDTYIEVAQNPYIANAKLKLQETHIFDQLLSIHDKNDESIAEAVKRSIVSLGTAVFQNADVNADKTRYAFSIVGEPIGEKLHALLLSLTYLEPEISEVFLNILGINDASEIFSLLTYAEGKIIFEVQNGSVCGITSEGLKFEGTKKGSVDLNLEIKGEIDDSINELFPKSDAGYRVTKVGSTSLDGSMSLVSSRGDKYAVKYDMSLNTNVDLLMLTLNGFDLEALNEDNFFHLRLSHRCSDICTEYCESRLAKAKGAVLDVAFSPMHFGTTNVYVCISLHSVLSKSFVNGVTKYDRSVTAVSTPEYAMLVIPASNLKQDNAFMQLLFQFYSIMTGIDAGSTVYLDLGEMREGFKDSRIAKVIMDNMLESEQYQIDTLKIKVDENVYGQARDYDIYKEVVYLKAYDEPELKSFVTALGKDYTAYSWNYEERKTASAGGESYVLNNIYDASGENLLHGADADGRYVPMSDREIEDLTGSTLKLEYVGYGGVSGSTFCPIVGIEGLDPTCFDEQEITLKVEYPNMLDYSFEFGDIAEKILESLFGGGSEAFVQNVKAKIKLTKESGDGAFVFSSADTDKKYRLTYNSSVPELLKATATIKYENGLKKDILTIGTSDSVVESMGLLSKQYSVVDWGKITVKFRVAGRSVERYFDVEKPDSFEFASKDGAGQIGASCYITSFATLKAVYADGKVNVKLTLRDFYINNISLNEAASDWMHVSTYNDKQIIFTKSNVFTVKVKKCGTDFGEFPLNISNTTSQKPTYMVNITGEPQSVVLKDARITFNGTITNKTHGSGEDNENTVEVKIFEYHASESGLISSEAAPDAYSLSLTVGSLSSENGSVKVSLPAMISEPITLRLNVTFLKAGIYRVVIRLNISTAYQFTISVM